MPSLLELQERFVSALDSPASAGHAVYRNTIAANYRNALGATYPVVRELVGWPFFAAAVDAFVAAEPPATGDLNVYGDRFAGFLEAYAPAASLAYLPDVARLEWQLDASTRAGDAAMNAVHLVGTLSQVPEGALEAASLRPHPSCRFMSSRFAVYEIWKSHQLAAPSQWSGEALSQPQHLMTRREGGRPVVERLPAAESAWLVALGEGAALGAAVDRALQVDPAFDLAAVLRQRIADGTIADFAAG
jgi:hypothetical protein